MEFIETLSELKTNVKVIEKYLKSKKDPEYSFALNLIKRGTCFVAIEEDGTYKFYPSRFMGYANNTMDSHLNNKMKDGRDTNFIISEILGKKPMANHILNNSYREYCKSLDFKANEKGSFGVERKFWEI